MILYEEVDETNVDLVKFPTSICGDVEEFRYNLLNECLERKVVRCIISMTETLTDFLELVLTMHTPCSN